MNEKEAYKFGVLQRCAEEALSPEETLERILRIEKRAEGGGLVDNVKSLAGMIFGWPLVGAAGVGALGGYGLAKLQEPDAPDPKSIQQKELIAAYNTFADQAEQRSQLPQPQRPRTIKMH